MGRRRESVINLGCRAGQGVVFLFVLNPVRCGLVFLGALPAGDRGVAVHLLDMSPPFVAAGLEADGASPGLWGVS